MRRPHNASHVGGVDSGGAMDRPGTTLAACVRGALPFTPFNALSTEEVSAVQSIASSPR